MRGMCMVDEVLLNKAAIIERCVARAREEYECDRATFADSFTRQRQGQGPGGGPRRGNGGSRRGGR